MQQYGLLKLLILLKQGHAKLLYIGLELVIVLSQPPK